MSKIIGAVEIGTSKAKALVGEVTENGSLSIVGMASRPNEGMRKGEIVDFRKAADAVHASLEEAEKMSGTTVDSVYLAQTGTHLRGEMLSGSASVRRFVACSNAARLLRRMATLGCSAP